ncbi:MAG: TrkH family potassium uptake protein [Methanosphaera sp.]|nr:TrkH family potassium uptake protein [Methanosphaera sp.]
MKVFNTVTIKANEYNIIAYYLAIVLMVVGIFMIIPIANAIIFHDPDKYLYSFRISALLSIIVGLILYYKTEYDKNVKLSLKASLFFVMLIWLITTLFSALPFLISGDLPFVDAYFESMSGITSTGFTLYESALLPYSIAIWRSTLQWFGGLGIIFLLLVISPSIANLKRLYLAEGKTEQINPNIVHNAINFIKIYLVLTVIGISLYMIAGLTMFDAVCYSFTALGTGGFSVNPTNLDDFINPFIQIVTLLLMIMGGTNFLIHYRIMRREWSNITKDIELRVFFMIIIVATIVIALNLYFEGFYNQDIIMILRHSLFQVTSVLTSTGFSTTDINLWTPFSTSILVLLMFIGGCVCSTAGGIKVYNIIIMFKSIVWEVQRMFLPKNMVLKTKIFHDRQSREISSETIGIIHVYIFMYVLLFIISTAIVLIHCQDIQLAVSVVAASVGNTGLAPSYIDASIPMIIKIVLIIDFWAGRIGIWPVLLPIFSIANLKNE